MIMVLLLYIALPAFQIVLFLYEQLSFGMGIPISEIINYSVSIAAVHWILANIIMGTKIPWLQKLVPYDKRIQFHIYSTAGILAAVGYHAVYKLANGYELETVTVLLISIFIILFAASILWIPLPGFKKLRLSILGKIKKGREIKYDSSKRIHIIIILALTGLITVHVINSGLLMQSQPVSVMIYALLFAATALFYLLSLTSLFKTGAKVVEVKEHEGILTISLLPKRQFSYRSGQFAFIEFRDKSMSAGEHPFSFLSCQVNKQQSPEDRKEIIQFAARKIGPFTHALSRLKQGDMVNIRGPFGNFHPKGKKRICLIGSGIGIVPLMSIVEELAAENTGQEITAFLSVNKRGEVPKLNSFLEMAGTLPNFKLHLLVYNEDGILFDKDYFNKMIEDKTAYLYYLCSSPFVRKIVVSSLTGLGVKRAAIRFEAFSFA